MSEKPKKERTWRLIVSFCLLLAIAGPFTYYSIQVFMWAKENQIEQYPDFDDLYRVAISAAATQLFKKVFEKVMWPLCKVIALGNNETEREENGKRIAIQMPQLINCLVISAWGYLVLRNTPHLPWWMGGSGTFYEAVVSSTAGRPAIKFDRDLYHWFLYAQGLYWGELFEIVFWPRNGIRNEEMILHHLTTVALTAGSTLVNEVGIGSVIAWLYLLTEFFIPLSKVLGVSIYQNLSSLIFLFNQMPSWFYFRIFCNALIIYYYS